MSEVSSATTANPTDGNELWTNLLLKHKKAAKTIAGCVQNTHAKVAQSGASSADQRRANHPSISVMQETRRSVCSANKRQSDLPEPARQEKNGENAEGFLLEKVLALESKLDQSIINITALTNLKKEQQEQLQELKKESQSQQQGQGKLGADIKDCLNKLLDFSNELSHLKSRFDLELNAKNAANNMQSVITRFEADINNLEASMGRDQQHLLSKLSELEQTVQR